MKDNRAFTSNLGILLSVVAPALGMAGSGENPSVRPGPIPRDARALAARIDEVLAARWVTPKVVPAPLADDAEFLRRAFLDLAGRIPPIFEVRDFLEDDATDKRQRQIDRLLSAPTFDEHFANVWRATLLPGMDNPERPV